MKLTKFDIGAEIISIITKGMYPDPKDALREYIQNGVDAGASEMMVKIRQQSIVIEDNGIGMNYEVLRKAVRVGISDKNPTKNVGFMGIGIYSSFHLCDNLTIFSRGSENKPNRLQMDFGKMKGILSDQKTKRHTNDISSEKLVDLQTLLEDCISLTENGDLKSADFPTKGTRVELSGIETEFYKALSDYSEVATYLRSVIPLKFDIKNFSYAEQIENKIREICEEHNQTFEVVNLTLQINGLTTPLYRPYKDSDFNRTDTPFEPQFFKIQREREFFGVAWGCLNSTRRILDNKDLRGFILKKQGFSIGTRESLVKFFPNRSTYFDRYSGEVIIVNTSLLPNASRNDLEYSPARSRFFDALAEVAEQFDEIAAKFQETDKANEQLSKIGQELKEQLGTYNEYEENPEELVAKIVSIKSIQEKLGKRIKNKNVDTSVIRTAEVLLADAKKLEHAIQQRIKTLATKQKQKPKTKSKVELAKNLSGIVVKGRESKSYESLYELLVDMDFSVDEDLEKVLFIIDEMFIQRAAKNKAEYYELLLAIQDRIQNE